MSAALYKADLYESNSGSGYLYENSPVRLTCMRAAMDEADLQLWYYPDPGHHYGELLVPLYNGEKEVTCTFCKEDRANESSDSLFKIVRVQEILKLHFP